MPTLPTITLPQDKFDRVVAAFPGETLQDKAAAYRAWLTNRIIDFVEKTEAKQIENLVLARRAELLAQLRDSLPPREKYPPTGGGA